MSLIHDAATRNTNDDLRGSQFTRIEFAAGDDDDYDAYLATFKGSLLFTPSTQRCSALTALPLAYRRDK